MRRTLLLLVGLGVLVGCGSPPASSGPRAGILRTMASESRAQKKDSGSGSGSSKNAPLMAPFSESGFELRGAEYWPYVGVAEPRYPEDVLWGFYPKKGEMPPGETDPNADSARPAAIACAQRAFAELHRFIANRPKDLDLLVDAAVKEQGVTRLFYLWVNDYTQAADPFPPGVRPARLWYWKRKVPDPQRPAGYWKWESTLTQRGECITPDFEAAAKYIREKKDGKSEN